MILMSPNKLTAKLYSMFNTCMCIHFVQYNEYVILIYTQLRNENHENNGNTMIKTIISNVNIFLLRQPHLTLSVSL